MPELTSDRLAQEFPGNERLVAEIYRKYREDSGSVDRQWAQIFARLEASAPAEAEPKAGAQTEPKAAAQTEPTAAAKVTEPKAATAPARGPQPKETSVSTGPKPKKTPAAQAVPSEPATPHKMQASPGR